MTTALRTTVVAAFDDPGKAESAIDELWHQGFTHDEVGFAVAGNRVVEATTKTGRLEDSGGKGAVAGSVAGGTLGALAGALVSTLLPGVGAILTGGFLAALAVGTAAGAAAGAYLGPFIALEMTDHDVRFFDREIRAGRTVVVVRADSPERAAKARAILSEYGGNDFGGEIV